MKKSLIPDRLSYAGTRPGSLGGDGQRRSCIPTLKKPTNANPPFSTLGGNRLSNRKFSGCRVSCTLDGAKKDARPLQQKSYQIDMINKLLDFLQRADYPHPINQRTLLSPQSKDFTKLFEFLFRFLHPTYVLPPKFEEEIPNIFRELRYPVSLAKSHLLTIGSQHSWPHLLGALHWLRQIVEMAIKTYEKPQMTDFDTPVEKQLYLDYMFGSYKAFLAGEDDFSKMDRDIEGKIVGHAVRDLEEELKKEAMLTSELKMFNNDDDLLMKLTTDVAAMDDDIKKFSAYFEDLDKHLLKKQEERCELEKRIQSQYEEEKLLKEDMEELKKKSKHQEANRAMYDEMFKEIQSLTQEKIQTEKEVKSSQQDIWNYEIETGKNNEHTEALCKAYNEKYRQLLLDLGVNLQNQDWELRPRFTSESIVLAESLKVQHSTLLKKINEKNRVLNAQLFSDDKSIARLEELLADTVWQKNEIESKRGEIETETGESKANFTRSTEKCQEEIKKYQAKLKETLSEVSVTDLQICELKKKCEELNESVRVEEKFAEETKKAEDNEFFKLCHMALDLKEEIEKDILSPYFRNCQKALKALKD